MMNALATRINRLLRVFYSKTKEIYAMSSDGLSISWENHTPQLQPPIPLLLRKIRKVKEDCVQTAVIIAAKWPGTFLYAELLEITVQMIRVGHNEQILILVYGMKKKQWSLTPGGIFMFKVYAFHQPRANLLLRLSTLYKWGPVNETQIGREMKQI
ncbi:MAG: hypothetical protein EZS28_028651 [Streblomastix strix]|uniref:Uncharacterized protein n=1 Tax=Streblomastix strix TaxID=222440 RepID=A0A5J4UZF8_9EUKA|nr:MAG: hypothetical protein EZS28_028651 [Streblomastix strix]